MKAKFGIICFAIMLIISSFAGILSINQETKEEYTPLLPEQKEKAHRDLSNLKGWFTENQGQIENKDVEFVYSGSGCSVGFMESGYLLKLTNEDNATSIVEVSFENSNPVLPNGLNELSHKSNFFYGNDSTQWKTEVPNYEKIVYNNLYDGIDLIFYTTEKGLKYDFHISPGADPDEISMSYNGARKIFVDSEGQLHITTKAGEFVEDTPFAYQQSKNISCNYQLEEKIIGFQLSDYDPTTTLVIDPLIYSTYVGGGQNDKSSGLVLDSEKNAYVTGSTESYDFPKIVGSYDCSHNDKKDVFIFKLNSNGSKLIYSTFIGAGDDEYGYNIILDSDNNAYVTGETFSSSFPTTNGCYDGSFNGNSDVFVLKLNFDGSELIYSTFVGKGDDEYGQDIVLDSDNNAYITGRTYSSNFPTTNGCYDDSMGGSRDIFVLKLNPEGSELIYSTFIGGGNKDYGWSIAIDVDKNVYVTGRTHSSNFPTTNGCYDDSHNGNYDVFIFKLNSDGSNLLYSTFVGSGDNEYGNSIVLDSEKNAYVTGRTCSSAFPTTEDCYDGSIGGSKDAFAIKLSSDGSDLIYSTFIGGEGNDYGYNIALDSNNNAYISGRTESQYFPTSAGCYDGSLSGSEDGFLFKLNSDGSELIYSTFFGGNNNDYGEVIMLDSKNNVCITGMTESSNFPTNTGCYDDTHDGSKDVFVFKLNISKPIAFIDNISPSLALDTTEVEFKGHGTDDGTIVRYVWISSIDGEIYNGTDPDFNTKNLSKGDHEIFFKVEDDNGIWSAEIKKNLLVTEKPKANIDSIYPKLTIKTNPVELKGYGIDDGTIERYVWISSIDGEIYNNTSPDYTISSLSIGEHIICFKVQDNNSFWSDEVSDTLVVTEKPRAHIDSISPNPALDIETVEFEGYGTDDGTIERYVWTSSIDGEIHNDTSSDFSTDNLSLGEHTIYLKVQDNYDVWSDEVTESLVVTEKPEASIDSISSKTSVLGQNFEFKGHGTDDGTITAYSWRSSNDGELNTESVFSTTDLSKGTHTIYFKVKDNRDVWSDEVSTTLTVHEKPVAHIDSVSPNPATDAEIVYFSGYGNDDGTIERYVWTSSIDGEIYNGTSPDFSTTDLSNGTHTLYFKVKDNYDIWSDEVSENLVVTEKPKAFIDSISPDPALGKDTVIFDGHGTDDGTIERYVWTSSIDGEIHNSTWGYLFSTDELSTGTHMIYFKVQDNYGVWSDEISESLEINGKPQAAIHSISPNPALDTDTVEFKGHGTDDGNIERYVWRSSVDGEIHNDTEPDFNTDELSLGEHAIFFKVQDNYGVWSDEVSTTLKIEESYHGQNTEENSDDTDFSLFFYLGLLAIVLIGFIAAIVRRRPKYSPNETEYFSSMSDTFKPPEQNSIQKNMGYQQPPTTKQASIRPKTNNIQTDTTSDQNIKLLRESENIRGYIRMKIAVQNQTNSTIIDASLKLLYDEKVFRLEKIEPNYVLSGSEARIGNVPPAEKKTVAFYLDPQMCTTSNMEAILTYRDHTGELFTVTMRKKEINVTCPIFFTRGTANTAMLKNLVDRKLRSQDSRLYSIPKDMPLLEAFEIANSAVQGRSIQYVRGFKKIRPFIAEAWYYGETKVKGYQIVIKASISQETNTIEIFAAVSKEDVLTGLLAELGHDLMEKLKAKGKPAVQVTNVSIKDSVLNRSSLLSNESSNEVSNFNVEDSVINRSGIGKKRVRK